MLRASDYDLTDKGREALSRAEVRNVPSVRKIDILNAIDEGDISEIYTSPSDVKLLKKLETLGLIEKDRRPIESILAEVRRASPTGGRALGLYFRMSRDSSLVSTKELEWLASYLARKLKSRRSDYSFGSAEGWLDRSTSRPLDDSFLEETKRSLELARTKRELVLAIDKAVSLIHDRGTILVTNDMDLGGRDGLRVLDRLASE